MRKKSGAYQVVKKSYRVVLMRDVFMKLVFRHNEVVMTIHLPLKKSLLFFGILLLVPEHCLVSVLVWNGNYWFL